MMFGTDTLDCPASGCRALLSGIHGIPPQFSVGLVYGFKQIREAWRFVDRKQVVKGRAEQIHVTLGE